MKTTLDLPDELIREVKLRAVVQRRTVKDLVAEFLRQGLGLVAPAQVPALPVGSMVQIGPGGLPVVRCRAKAPAARMSAAQLLRLEQAAQTEADSSHVRLPV